MPSNENRTSNFSASDDKDGDYEQFQEARSSNSSSDRQLTQSLPGSGTFNRILIDSDDYKPPASSRSKMMAESGTDPLPGTSKTIPLSATIQARGTYRRRKTPVRNKDDPKSLPGAEILPTIMATHFSKKQESVPNAEDIPDDDENTNDKETQQLQESEEIQDAQWFCPRCRCPPFNTQSGCLQHLTKCHPGARINLRGGTTQPLKVSHCVVSGFTLEAAINFRNQYLRDNPKKYKCHFDGCFESYDTIASRCNHEKKHSTTYNFKCMLCCHLYKTYVEMRSHLNDCHRYPHDVITANKLMDRCKDLCTSEDQTQPTFNCVYDGCTFHTEYLGRFREHLLTHNTAKYTCQSCQLLLTSTAELRKHVDDHHPGFVLVCTQNVQQVIFNIGNVKCAYKTFPRTWIQPVSMLQM